MRMWESTLWKNKCLGPFTTKANPEPKEEPTMEEEEENSSMDSNPNKSTKTKGMESKSKQEQESETSSPTLIKVRLITKSASKATTVLKTPATTKQ